MSQALYRKWRPHLWGQVVGQEHVVQTLQNAIRGGRVGHAYLFAGPRGTGKTTSARLLAKAVNCLAKELKDRPCDHCDHCQAVNDGRFLDLIEIDAASNTSVDDVRDLREKINFSPSQGRFKVYIIDEVHMLSTAAFNALLKTLEEPPPHAIFILATTEVHKIPATVLSRCQRHEFRRIPLHLIVSHLKELAEQEKINVDEEALTLIARQATGSMRDAISLLDQLASSGIQITLETAQTVLGTATSQMVVELVDTVLQRDPASGLVCIHRALDSGSDPRQFARQVVDYLRNLLLVRLGNADQVDATAEQRTSMAKQAQSFEKEHLLETLKLFNGAASEVRSGWQPGLPLELALAHAIGWREELTAAPEKIQPAATQPTGGILKRTPPASESSAAQTPVPAATPQADAEEARPAARSVAAEAAGDDPPAAEGHPTPAGIRDNWAKIRAVVKRKQPMIEALLNSCKSVELREGVLQLSFGSPVLKAKMEKDDNLQIVTSAVKQVLGWDIPVTCIDATTKGGQMQSNSDVDADGMVNAALNLGGKIVQKE
ncbi:MAG TPA: DNA polymerase III subunit gamma/tau [Anaerolineaceae bacterium]|nr:MAG: DNA polymerase III, subunit gamma and tau [Chloroflexi bacterium GWB2_54_36]HAL15772.1 DNA polymerase III subunit gamma/tau [Anaerolineaceae bacterium]